MGADKAQKYYQKGVKAYKKNNYSKAIEYFERARELGSVDAVFELGYIYHVKDDFKNPKKAKMYFKEVIDKGYVDSRPGVLVFYAEIEEFYENYETARFYYEKAMEEYGNKRAIRNLAKMFLEGRGAPYDVDRAEELMCLGLKDDEYAEYLEPEFFNRLKEIRDEQEKVRKELEAKRRREESLEIDRIAALGVEAYLSGDYDTAFKLLIKTIPRPKSCFYLALMYKDGLGTEKDEERAFELLEFADSFYDGEPTKKYLIQWRNERFELAQEQALKVGGDAYKKADALWASFSDSKTYMPYYEEAARAGIFEAQIKCAEYYYGFFGSDKKKALYWYEAVAAHDSPDNNDKILNAHYMCGLMYEEENDEEKAYQHYLICADQGDRKAATKCVRIMENRGNYANYFEELKKFAIKGFPGAMLELGIECYNGYVALSRESEFEVRNGELSKKYFGEDVPDADASDYRYEAKRWLTAAMMQTEDEKIAAKAKKVRQFMGD